MWNRQRELAHSYVDFKKAETRDSYLQLYSPNLLDFLCCYSFFCTVLWKFQKLWHIFLFFTKCEYMNVVLFNSHYFADGQFRFIFNTYGKQPRHRLM